MPSWNRSKPLSFIYLANTLFYINYTFTRYNKYRTIKCHLRYHQTFYVVKRDTTNHTAGIYIDILLNDTDMNAIITLQEYLKKGKTFVVPEYQRSYVWGKKRVGEEKDSVTNLMEDLISHFFNNKNADVFLQGITVAEKEKEIIKLNEINQKRAKV